MLFPVTNLGTVIAKVTLTGISGLSLRMKRCRDMYFEPGSVLFRETGGTAARALKLISQGRDHAMDNPYILDRQPF